MPDRLSALVSIMKITSSHDRPAVNARVTGFGFTLIELLIMIAILAVLAALLVVQAPRLLDNARSSHTTTAAVTNGGWVPRHRGAPKANNKLGEMGNILFMDGHVESRVMSMNPIDQKEWDELGTWSQGQGRSNILQ